MYQVWQSYPEYEYMSSRRIGRFKTEQSAVEHIKANGWKNCEIIKEEPIRKSKLKKVE